MVTTPKVHQRGAIEGFSSKAASRLREFCVCWEVPDRVPLAFTLTTHGMKTPEEWRTILMRFRQRARQRSVPFVWRVELQRRETPHLHGVAWVAANHREAPEHRRLFTEDWLECVGEDHDKESRRHAVQIRELENSSWLVYVALHHGRHKNEQLGWKGKQWGVVGRDMFRPREPESIEVTERRRIRFQRVLRRLLAPKGRKKARALPRDNTWLRCVDGEMIKRVLDQLKEYWEATEVDSIT